MSKENGNYYGAFFWLSLAAFIVPVIVAARAFQGAPRPHTKPTPKPDASGVDNELWDYLLKAYVETGRVDYDGMKRDYLFRTYLRQLGASEPEKLSSDQERLALMCNAYNAFVINGVITHKVTASVLDHKTDGTGFFDLEEHIFAGKTVSLNHLEHKVIRPTFKEPRIHMALVCAAKSCPAIRPEAYRGVDLDKQLEDQARLFANNPEHVSYDADSETIHLSAILKWYGSDFEAGGYLKFLAERVDDEDVKSALIKADKGEVKTAFNKYDWSLNGQSGGATPNAGGGSAEFGSGSVPNE